MALQFLGKDPDSEQGDSPTIWDDGDSYIIQGWKLDTETLAGVGEIPAHETVLRLPKRMMQFFPEVSGGGSSASA